MNLKHFIRSYQNFPRSGVLFHDLASLISDPDAFRFTIYQMAAAFAHQRFDLIAGLETRGLVFASALAFHLDCGMIMLRKAGKLAGPTERLAYTLEYGSAELEIQKTAITAGQRILLVDDVLATGGSAKTGIQLIEALGGEVVGCIFVMEILKLRGREALQGYELKSLVEV